MCVYVCARVYVSVCGCVCAQKVIFLREHTLRRYQIKERLLALVRDLFTFLSKVIKMFILV
jgi:hypothetical protein